MSMTRTQYFLTKLAEEASEVAQIALKCSQFGLEEVYSSGASERPLSNADRLKGELNDLIGVLQLLEAEEAIMEDWESPNATDAKGEKVMRYMGYCQNLGTVER